MSWSARNGNKKETHPRIVRQQQFNYTYIFGAVILGLVLKDNYSKNILILSSSILYGLIAKIFIRKISNYLKGKLFVKQPYQIQKNSTTDLSISSKYDL